MTHSQALAGEAGMCWSSPRQPALGQRLVAERWGAAAQRVARRRQAIGTDPLCGRLQRPI